MATLPPASAGEVRLTLTVPDGDLTPPAARGYVVLFPNLAPGTRYRASNVDPIVADRVVCPLDSLGQIRNPEGTGWPVVLASNASGHTHPGLQWVMEFHLENVYEQPADVYFTVPAGSYVNVGLIADPTPQPSVHDVYVEAGPLLDVASSVSADAEQVAEDRAAVEALAAGTDSQVAGFINSSGSATRAAADARYALLNPPATRFNFSKYSPAYYTILDQVDTALVQAFVINETTGDIFTTQVASGFSADVTQSIRLSRLSTDGQLLDYMTLRYTGHGTLLHLEQVGSDTYIYTHWYKTVDTGTGTGTEHGLARFKYTAGATWLHTNPGIQWLAPFSTEYVSVFGDQQNARVGYRTSVGASEVITVHTLANVKAGVSAPLYTALTIDTAVAGTTMQGASLDGDRLYWLTGAPNGPIIITEWDLVTRTLVQKKTVVFGDDPDGGYEDSNYEPEAIYLYKNPLTGAKSLFVGLATGVTGQRNPKMYAYHEPANAPFFVGERFQRFDRWFTHETEWKNLPLASNFSALDAESVPQYRRFGGKTELRGTVNYNVSGGITEAMVCATLPAGFRPKTYVRVSGASSSATEPMRRINIGPDAGNIELNRSGSGGITWQSLDSIPPFES